MTTPIFTLLFSLLGTGVAMADTIPPSPANQEVILGGGCFWCLEAVYEGMRGVLDVTSGYAGGQVPSPNYEAVCTGGTGHAEVVKIRFDPGLIRLDEIFEVFWAIHDPTTQDRQDRDIGSQYRSIILYQGEAQRAAAAASMAAAASAWRDPIVTELLPLQVFYPAEDYHQDYFARNPDKPYCAFVVGPKVEKFKKRFADRLAAP